MMPRPPISTLFPYTTLFRSDIGVVDPVDVQRAEGVVVGYLERLIVLVAERLEEIHVDDRRAGGDDRRQDRKSTRLNSSHSQISYAVFCLKKKKKKKPKKHIT